MLLELYILSFTAIKLRSSTENANNTERALAKDHNGVTSFLSRRQRPSSFAHCFLFIIPNDEQEWLIQWQYTVFDVNPPADS